MEFEIKIWNKKEYATLVLKDKDDTELEMYLKKEYRDLYYEKRTELVYIGNLEKKDLRRLAKAL